MGLGLVVAVGGCARTHGGAGAADGGAPAAPQVRERAFDLSGGFVHVEVRIPQTPPGRKPLVLGPLGLEERLLARGIAVARFDVDWSRLEGLRALKEAREAKGPSGVADGASPEDAAPSAIGGETADAPATVGAWMLAAPRPGIVGRGYFELIGATARQIVPRVVGRLAELPEIDPERIGIAGSSTHGFVALEALAEDPRLAAAVVRVACGDYRRFLRSSSLGLDDDPRWLEDGELVLDADYDAELRAREPLRHAERYPPRPLLLLNGSEDPAIPRACAERTAAALREAYAQAGVPDRFRFDLFEGAAHDLGAAADDRVLAWWTRWLLDAPPEGS